MRSIKGAGNASTHSDPVGVPLQKLFTLADKGECFIGRLNKITCSFTMDGKGVKKLTNSSEDRNAIHPEDGMAMLIGFGNIPSWVSGEYLSSSEMIV